jgi:hypothetical protein
MIWLNLLILGLNIAVYLANRKLKVNSKIYTLPIIKGQGVVILNKDGKPVVEFEKPLK